MNDNKYNNSDPTTNGVNNPDSNSENDLEKMMRDLSNQIYGSIVEDHANYNQVVSD